MFKFKNTFLLIGAFIIAINGIAQSNANVNTSNTQETNYLAILMLTVAGLLAVVIWILGSILLMLSKKAVDLSKSRNKIVMIGWIVMGTLFTNAANAQATMTDSAAVAPSVHYYGGLSGTTFWTLSTVVGLELLVVFALVFFIKNMWNAMHPIEVVFQKDKKSEGAWFIKTWNHLDKKFFTKAIPLEEEADRLLDHDYDGIKELDNALPPWWKYGFIITIFIAVLYLLKYEIWHNGPNPTEEYNEEMTSAKEQVDAYLVSMKNNVDEHSVTMSDASGIAAGKVTFSKTCVACHGANGEGGVGPNLTDDYWLHGGSIADVFKTIKYGYPDKGMQSWQSTISPIQMQELASYIKTLKGTNPPNGKAPQGDLFKEVVVLSDSTNLPRIDSVNEVK